MAREMQSRLTVSERHYRLAICGILLFYILALVAGVIHQCLHPLVPEPASPPDECST